MAITLTGAAILLAEVVARCPSLTSESSILQLPLLVAVCIEPPGLLLAVRVCQSISNMRTNMKTNRKSGL
jgi:hypothetical protein